MPAGRTKEPDSFLGRSSTADYLRAEARRLGTHGLPVLVTGEPGAGKLALARQVARHSESHRELVVVDAALVWVDGEAATLSFSSQSSRVPDEGGLRIGERWWFRLGDFQPGSTITAQPVTDDGTLRVAPGGFRKLEGFDTAEFGLAELDAVEWHGYLFVDPSGAAGPFVDHVAGLEAIVAPSFEPAAVGVLPTRPKWRQNVRLLEVGELGPSTMSRHRSVTSSEARRPVWIASDNSVRSRRPIHVERSMMPSSASISSGSRKSIGRFSCRLLGIARTR